MPLWRQTTNAKVQPQPPPPPPLAGTNTSDVSMFDWGRSLDKPTDTVVVSQKASFDQGLVVGQPHGADLCFATPWGGGGVILGLLGGLLTHPSTDLPLAKKSFLY